MESYSLGCLLRCTTSLILRFPSWCDLLVSRFQPWFSQARIIGCCLLSVQFKCACSVYVSFDIVAALQFSAYYKPWCKHICSFPHPIPAYFPGGWIFSLSRCFVTAYLAISFQVEQPPANMLRPIKTSYFTFKTQENTTWLARYQFAFNTIQNANKMQL